MHDRLNSPLRRTDAQLNQNDNIGYAGAGSFQVCAADLDVSSGVGKDVASGTAFIAAMMGNLLGDTLTKTGNYLGGGIFHYSVLGSKSSTYPVGAVLAGIGDSVTEADGAVVAYVDGDGGQTKAGAAFKVRCNNSTAGSGFDYGIDLQDAAHDGFLPVDATFYKKAQIRLTEDVVLLTGSAAPTDGVTGADVAGSGSLYSRSGDNNGAVYINTGTKASPAWKAITHA